MKIFLTVITLVLSQLVMAQTIQQMSIFPVNPTINDTVLLIADLQFASSSCNLDRKSHQINGNTIVANTQHCVGIATAICYASDTFVLGKLNSGNYTVNLSLLSGGAPIPCTPGIVPSDFDTLNFTVQSTLGIQDVVLPSFTVYPNPAGDFIVLSDAYQQVVNSVKIVSITGAVVLKTDAVSKEIDVSGLAPGVYSMEIIHSNGSIVEKFMKE